MDHERLLSYHRFTREHGVNRAALPPRAPGPAARSSSSTSGSRASGASTRKVTGPLIVAANHRSFLDPFVIGASLPWRRPLHYVAKVELFEPRWQGWILNRLGAYPVRRGQSDEETLITSREVLERGGADLHLPRGDADPDRLARPGRSAASAGSPWRPAPPCCRSPCTAPSRCRNGWRSARARSRCAPGARSPSRAPRTPRRPLANSVGARIWPVIELQWEWLGGLPPLRKAAVIGAGQLGHGGRRPARPRRARGPARLPHLRAGRGDRREPHNERYLPGVQLPEWLSVKRASEIELAGMDLVCLGVPSDEPPGTPSARSATASGSAPRC